VLELGATQERAEGVKRVFIVAGLVLGLVYGGDYLSVRLKIPKGRDPFGTVQVQRYYSVMKKDGKPDFYFDQPQNQTCVRSLFPHLGYSPCWYLNRHKVQKIDV
jgi:hypothetical protein